jgi:hypothetical protein
MEEEAMIYFWKSKDGDGVYFNTDIEEAKKDDYTTKPKESCTQNDWYTVYECTARLVKGSIVLGKTQEEKDAEAAQKRKEQIVAEIEQLENKGLRASRAVALNIATEEDLNKLQEIETAIAGLRAEYESL